MPLTQISKTQWQAFFDRVAKALPAKQVEIEVAGLGLGDRIAAKWVPLIGMSYDPKGDCFIVSAEGIEHRVHHPKQIHADADADTLHSVEAIDAENNHHIVLLKDPLRLPAP